MPLFRIALLCAFLSNLPLNAQEEEEEDREFHGPVKTAELILVEYRIQEDGTIDSLDPVRYYIEYDQKKNPIVSISYGISENDEPYETKRYEYDKEGQVIQIKTEHQFGGTDVTEYKYDDAGQLIQLVEKSGTTGSEWKEKYAYDSKGNLILAECYDGEVGYQGKITYSYDDRANKVEEKTIDRENYVLDSSIWVYNNQNKLEREEKYEEGELTGKTVYTFDASGKLIRSTENATYYYMDHENVIEYDSLEREAKMTVHLDGVFEKYYTLDYFSETHYIMKMYDKNGKFVYSEETKDDSLGNPLYSDRMYAKAGTSTTYKYIFDDQNNWTSCLIYNEKNQILYRATVKIVYW